MKTKSEQWETHKRVWSACSLCPQAAWTHKKCFYRGDSFLKRPIDVLFVGEAPGRNENAQGKPFVGEAGVLLDRVIRHLRKRFDFTYGVTNLVSCLPDLDAGDMTAPKPKQVSNCADRLKRMIQIAEPKCFVFLGNSAADRAKKIARIWIETKRGKSVSEALVHERFQDDPESFSDVAVTELIAETCFVAVVHPSAVLRKGGDDEVNKMQYEDICRARFERFADASLIKRKRKHGEEKGR